MLCMVRWFLVYVFTQCWTVCLAHSNECVNIVRSSSLAVATLLLLLLSKMTKMETFTLCLTCHLILLLGELFFLHVFFFFFFVILRAKQIFKYVTWFRWISKVATAQPFDLLERKDKIDSENNLKLMTSIHKILHSANTFSASRLVRTTSIYRNHFANVGGYRSLCARVRRTMLTDMQFVEWKRKLIDVQLDKRNCG